MWEARYAADEYAYGEEPNPFFKACLDGLAAPGRLLLPAEGEAEVHEGRHHTGLASVVRLVGTR